MNKVITNQEYLPTLLKLLKKAENSIDLMAFSFAIGSRPGAPLQIARALLALKEEHGKKIKIRVYLEGARDTSEKNRATAVILEKGGIEVKFGATHAKGFCVDKKSVLFGSTNLTNQSIMKNNEANLYLEGKKWANGFLEYFEHLWAGGAQGDIELSEPYLADGAFKDVIIAMINRAKKQIDFSIYFFNHREIEAALIMAHESGISVRGFIHQHKTFAMPYIWANKATVKRLRAAGLTDLYFSIPDKFSHSKYIVVDEKELALGTGNWLVEDVTTHPQLYFHLKSVPLGRGLLKHLDYQISEQATED